MAHEHCCRRSFSLIESDDEIPLINKVGAPRGHKLDATSVSA